MINARVKQLEPNPLMVEIERMQQAGYGERRINAHVARSTRASGSGWTRRLWARVGRPAAANSPAAC